MSVLETTTRWLDETKTSLNEVDSLMKLNHPDENNPNGPSYLSWDITTAEGDPIKASYAGNELFYRLYRFSFYQVPQGASIDDSLTSFYSGWILVYELKQKIHYIINRNSDSKRILRKILKYTGKNELIQESTRAYGDLYVWLISKVYGQNNLIENSDDTLSDITIDEKIQILIDDMIDTMHKYNGVGLAAVQVGILKRVLVIDLYDENRTCCNDKSCNIKNKRCRRNGRRMFKLSKSIC